MNLQKLFQIQKQLDDRIIKQHGLEGQDLLDKKILALQVELGELANEHRGFKFWSKDQEPNTDELSIAGHKARRYNPLLEEFVDCLHFILSIGLEHEEYLDQVDYEAYVLEDGNFTEQFQQVFKSVSDYAWYLDGVDYYEMACQLLGLGEMLGFTDKEIYDAYLDKNKINHTRQDSNY